MNETKECPLEYRNITQLVYGLETMLVNLRQTHSKDETTQQLINNNYEAHLKRLEIMGYKKMVEHYKRQYKAWSRSYL